MFDFEHLPIVIALSVLSSVLMYMCSYKMLQVYQMSSYRTKEVFAWQKNNKFEYILRFFSLAFFIFVPTALFISCFGKYEYYQYLGFIFFIGLSLLFFIIMQKQVKIPLRFTGRIVRLSLLLIIVYFIVSFLLIIPVRYVFLQYSFIAILPQLIPALVALCNTLMLPIEKMINGTYKRKAIKKLESMPSLIKIGITGSYGKTTAKNILTVLLSQKYKVCASPKSYNTPMGLTRFINSDLTDDVEILIAEMGARYVGDIKELCLFIKPRIGLLTAIGNMHLETFGSIEKIIKTKYELVDNLSDDGLVVFCGDSEILEGLYHSCKINKLLSGSDDSRVKSKYSNVLQDENGTSFDLLLDNETVKITTKLLGNHIPGLVAACALTAYELGVSPAQIAEGAAKLEQVPHRLELIKNGNSIIIDDAYNSNPEGAKNALEILSRFEGTKIVVTPGMVELGEKTNEFNHAFGRDIAAGCDYAILVGRNALSIKAGIMSSDAMSGEKIIVVKTLKEAIAELEKIRADKKIILFENDLPDNY